MGKKVSFSAVAMALSVICLYAAAFMPTGRLVALALSSLFVAACNEQYGVRYGVVVFVGTSIISLLFIQKRLFVVVYLLFAGLYPIAKLYIERLRKLWAEWVLKLLYFNVMLALFYLLFQLFFLPMVTSAHLLLIARYMGLVAVGLEVAFVLYDLALSYMIGYYHQFLRRIHYE